MPEFQVNPFVVPKAPLKGKDGKPLPEKHAKNTEEIRKKLELAQQARKADAMYKEKERLLQEVNLPGLVKAVLDPVRRKELGVIPESSVKKLMEYLVEQARPDDALEVYILSEKRFPLDAKFEHAVQRRYAQVLERWNPKNQKYFPYEAMNVEVRIFGYRPDYVGQLRPVVQSCYAKFFRAAVQNQMHAQTVNHTIFHETQVPPEVDSTGPMAEWFGERVEARLQPGGWRGTAGPEGQIRGLINEFGLQVRSYEGARKTVIERLYIPTLRDLRSRGEVNQGFGAFAETIHVRDLTQIVPSFERDEAFRDVMMSEIKNSLSLEYPEQFNALRSGIERLGSVIPLQELKETVQLVYRKKLDKDTPDEYSLRAFRDATNIPLEFVDKEKKCFMKAAGRLLRKGEAGRFQELLEALEPADRFGYEKFQHRHDVTAGYEAAIRDTNNYAFDHLQELEIVEPDSAKLAPLIQKQVLECITRANTGGTEELEAIAKRLGVTIDWKSYEPVLRKRYKQWICEHNSDSLRFFTRKSGILPDYKGELFGLVQAGYGAMIKKTDVRVDGTIFKSMVVETGVDPDFSGVLKSSLNKRWSQLLTHGSESFHCASPKGLFARESELTGVRPDYAGELYEAVQKAYVLAAKRGDWLHIRQGQVYTQVPVEKDLIAQQAIRYIETNLSDIYSGYSTDSDRIVQEVSGIHLLDERVSWKDATPDFYRGGIDKLISDDPKLQTKILERARREVPECLHGLVRERLFIDAIDLISKYKARISPEVLSELLAQELAGGALSPEVIRLFVLNKQKMEVTASQLEVLMETQQPRELAMVYRYTLPTDAKKKEEAKAVFEKSGDWKMMMSELLDMKGPADKPEFCPWKQEMTPLLEGLYGSDSVNDRDHYRPLTRGKFDEKDAVSHRGLLEFVKRFGMKNLPLLAETVILLQGLKEHGIFERSPEALKKFWQTHPHADSNLDWRWRRIMPEDVDTILGEIEQRMEAIKKEILEDRIPTSFESSPLDMELFNAIVVRGESYGSMENRQQLIQQWRTSAELAQREGRPESVKVPAGYVPMTMDVAYFSGGDGIEAMMRKAEQEAGDEDAMEVREKKLKILRDKLEAVQNKEPYVKFVKPLTEMFLLPAAAETDWVSQLKEREALVEKARERLRKAVETEGNNLSPGKKMGMERAIAKERERVEKLVKFIKHRHDNTTEIYLEHEIDRLTQELYDKSAEWDEKKNLDIAPEDQEKYQSQRSAFEGWYKQQERVIARIVGLNNKDVFQFQFEVLRLAFGEDLMEVAGQDVHRLMANLVKREAAGHVNVLKNAVLESSGVVTSHAREALARLYEDELLPHFLDSKNFHAKERAVPFSPELQNLLESTFKTTQIRKRLMDEVSYQHRFGKASEKAPKHPFFDVLFEARHLESQIEAIEHPEKAQKKTRESRQVTFYPSHGLTRVFAGDIANACYDKLRTELANNEYQNLNAITMATTEGKDTHILGNFLLIESKDVEGRSTIIIRALNPTQTSIKEGMDSADLVERAIEYATEIAKNRNIDRVLMCMDDLRGGHASNVQEVYDAMSAYTKKKSLPIAGALQYSKDTSFNGHLIYLHGATRVAWERANAMQEASG